MRRGRNIALLGVACVVVLAAVAWLNRPKDEPTKATVGDAVQSFRTESGGEKRKESRGEPALGVYRYSTQGFESAQNSVVGGATHDYGGISTITLSPGRCGQRERWQVLDGRWSEGELCRPSTDKATSTLTEFHEFFGVDQEDSFLCRFPSISTARLRRPGTRISSSCESDNSSVSTATHIVGIEPISVGGVQFDAIHSTSRSLFKGGTSGAGSRDEWRRRSDGLLLRRSASSNAETSSGGGNTDYSERYTLRLLAVTPRR